MSSYLIFKGFERKRGIKETINNCLQPSKNITAFNSQDIFADCINYQNKKYKKSLIVIITFFNHIFYMVVAA